MKKVIIPVLVAVITLALGITFFSFSGKSEKSISKQNANSQIAKEAKKIGAIEAKHSSMAISTSDSLSTADELPDLDTEYPIVVQGNGDIDIEIWTSPEKGGSKKDGFLVDLANEFNEANHMTSDGESMSVTIRSIASGTAIDYMSSGKATPDLYTPSNDLWGDIASEDGMEFEVIDDCLVQNTAGIIISNSKYKELKENGTVDFEAIYNAVLNDECTIGYPNPYSSSTGMNFLLNALYASDDSNLLSDEAIEKFQTFQSKVALTSYTTQQLVKSAENGTVDSFVMEYQSYINDGTLETKYKFVPFGYSHDNPVYQVGSLSDSENEVVSAFMSLCDENSALAKKDGFNTDLDYTSSMPEITGHQIKAAQSIWKESKDSGNTVLMEFVFDISGSMESDNRYENLKTAFLNSMDYINSDNYVGVISYNGNVYKDVALNSMDITQKGKIKGALYEISPAGKTAMYDAIIVAMNELNNKESELGDTNVKKMVVVLTDGQSNYGNEYSDVKKMIENSGIPVYTISYDYQSDDLQNIADLNEAEYVNGTNEDIILKLKNLFQAIA